MYPSNPDDSQPNSNGDALLHRGQVKLTQEDIGGAVRDLRRAVHVRIYIYMHDMYICVRISTHTATHPQHIHPSTQVDERPPPVAYACLGTALFKLDDTGESAQEALAEAAEKYPGSLEVCMCVWVGGLDGTNDLTLTPPTTNPIST